MRPAVDVRLHFAFNQATLTPEAAPQVVALAQALLALQAPGRRLHLIGHTDSRGDDAYNDRLAQQRAETARQAILQRAVGLDPTTLVASGRGKRELLYPTADTEAHHALSRRVEVRVE